jgi:hypothetical protein
MQPQPESAPEQNIDENEGVVGDAGNINELNVPEATDDDDAPRPSGR